MSKAWEIVVTSILSALLGAGATFWVFTVQISRDLGQLRGDIRSKANNELVGELSGTVKQLNERIKNIEPEYSVARATKVVIEQVDKKIDKDVGPAVESEILGKLPLILKEHLEKMTPIIIRKEIPYIVKKEIEGEIKPIIFQETKRAFMEESSQLKENLDSIEILSKKAINHANAVGDSLETLSDKITNTEGSFRDINTRISTVEEKSARNITFESGKGPLHNQDKEDEEGKVDGRELKFNKRSNETSLRISYTDIFHVHEIGNTCSWIIKVNGRDCSNGSLEYFFYGEPGKQMNSSTLVGYCNGIISGENKITIYSKGGGKTTCLTGWNKSRWIIEVEEVYIGEPDK